MRNFQGQFEHEIKSSAVPRLLGDGAGTIVQSHHSPIYLMPHNWCIMKNAYISFLYDLAYKVLDKTFAEAGVQSRAQIILGPRYNVGWF